MTPTTTYLFADGDELGNALAAVCGGPLPPMNSRPRTTSAELRELIGILEPHWPALSADARRSGLVAEGDGGSGGSGQGGGSGSGSGSGSGDGAGAGSGGSGDGGSGGSGQGGGSGSGSGSGDGAGAGSGGSGDGGSGGSGQGGGQGGQGGSGDGGGASGGESITVPKSQYDLLQEAVATSNRKLRELERKQEEADEEAKKKGGKHEELYEAEKNKNAGLIKRLGDNALNSAVEDVAKRLNFRNPSLARSMIDLAGVEASVDADTLDVKVGDSDKTVIEKRLAELADKEPYLVDERRTRQMPGAGEGGQGSGGGNGNDAMNDALRRAAGRQV